MTWYTCEATEMLLRQPKVWYITFLTMFHIAALKNTPLFFKNPFRRLNKNSSKWTYLHPASKRLVSKGMQDMVTWRVSAEFRGSESKTCVIWHRWAAVGHWFLQVSPAKQCNLIEEPNSTWKNPKDAAEALLSSSSTSEALQTETSLSWKHPTNTSVIYRMTFSTIAFKGTKHTHTHSQRRRFKPSAQQPLQPVVLKNTWSVSILFASRAAPKWVDLGVSTYLSALLTRSCLVFDLLFVVKCKASQSFGAAFNILPLFCIYILHYTKASFLILTQM